MQVEIPGKDNGNAISLEFLPFIFSLSPKIPADDDEDPAGEWMENMYMYLPIYLI